MIPAVIGLDRCFLLLVLEYWVGWDCEFKLADDFSLLNCFTGKIDLLFWFKFDY